MNNKAPTSGKSITISGSEVHQDRASCERLLKSHEQFRKALCAIAYSSHCIYEDTYSQYQIGVADGHRCAANTAKEALNGND